MKVVMFDIGRVLVPDGDRVSRLTEALHQFGLDPDEGRFMDAYWRYRNEYDLGWSDEMYWSKVLEEVGYGGVRLAAVDFGKLGAVDAERTASISEDNAQFVNWLVNKGVVLGLLSNAPFSMIDTVRNAQWSTPFQVKVFSSEVGCAKPSQEVYDIAFARLREELPNLRKEDVTFFDDRIENVEAAQVYGWKAHQWINARSAQLEIDGELSL